MDLRQFVRTLRDRWLLIVLSLILFVGAALAFDAVRKPTYAADTQLFVSTSEASQDLSQTYQGGLFAQQRVQSYAQIVDSPAMVKQIIARLRLNATVREIQDEISASVPVDTVLINVTVKDRSPVRAKRIADAVAVTFPSFVNSLEQPQSRSASPVKISITSRAELPTSPVSPARLIDLALALLLGLVVGVGAAFARDAFDTHVRDADGAAAVVGAPVIGRITHLHRQKGRLAVADGRSKQAEDFRRLRTNIRAGQGFRSLVVSSAVPSEGKTTVVANLGIALAQAGFHVVLVDADLRHPMLGRVLGLSNKAGLSDVLAGRAQPNEAILRWRQGYQLDVLPAGTIPQNPSELLGSERLNRLLGMFQKRCDIVIFDSPAVLEFTDAAVVGKLTSDLLLVSRPSAIHVDELESATEALRAAGVLVSGLVLNGVRASRNHYRSDREGGGRLPESEHVPVPSRKKPVETKRNRRRQTASSIKPKEQPIKPKEQPIKPKEQPIKPKEQPIKPKEQPIKPKEQPIKPKEQPIELTEQPIQPTEQEASPGPDEGEES
jgi:succinoglycan biosynthesis transport protein ExoP